jgi:iron complex outermembrane receptor protein
MIHGKVTKHSKYLLSPFLLAIALGAFAQDHSELPEFTEEDIFMDIPQIISATHLSQKLTEAPASISIIDQQMIEASGALNIPDLFRLVPGMQVYHVSTNKMAATYHGMSDDFPSRMEVMINGRSIYIPMLSTVVWETIGISVDDIDHIEVVRGSNVPTHGSNAFLGAINIITKSPVSESGTQFKATTGALGTENFTARHSNTLAEISYTLSAGSQKNDGIEPYNDAGRNKYVTITGSITPNLSDTIHFDIGATDGYAYRGDGDKADPIEADFSPREHRSNFQDIRWNRVLINQSEFELRYTHNYLKLDTENYNAEELAVLESVPVAVAELLLAANNGIAPKDNERGEVDTHDISAIYTAYPTEKVSTVTGASYRYERARSDVLLQQATSHLEGDTLVVEYPGIGVYDWVDENRWKLFGNIEYHATDDITLNIGAMFEESSIAGGDISYRAGANYALTDFSTIRAAYSHAHRMPSLLEANSFYAVDLITDVDIYTAPYRSMESEEIESFEIGYLQLWPEYSSHIEVRAFHEEITKAMVRGQKIPATDDDGDLDISNNNAEWTNQGFEAQFKYTSPATHQSSFLLNYAYNHTDGLWDRGYYPPELHRTESLNSRTPLHTASILVSTKPTANSLIGLSHYYMDHVEWLEGFSDKNSGRTNYTRTDIKLSNTFTLDANSEVELSLIVQNVFDKEYAEFYSNNTFDRRTYLQLGLTF